MTDPTIFEKLTHVLVRMIREKFGTAGVICARSVYCLVFFRRLSFPLSPAVCTATLI